MKLISLSYIVLFFISTLSNAQSFDINYGTASQIGTINNSSINEASGLASSYNTPGAFWLHNDSGDGPNIFLINAAGNTLTAGSVSGATSRDWEDIASFVVDGNSYLMIGEVGDNPSNKSEYRLYIIEEPVYDSQSTSGNSYPIVRTITYQYENGSQNCESIAVDVENGKIILVSKSGSGGNRFVYEIPLSVTPGSIATTASLIGQFAMDGTTAMDISNDGQHAMVLTYDDAYEFSRYDGTTWNDAFATTPRKITMPNRGGGEAIAYGRNAVDLYLVREGSSSPVWFIEGQQEQGAVFQVDMIEKTDVYNDQVWLNIVGGGSPILMTDTDSNYIYACKVDLALDTNFEYYFSYQNGVDANTNIVVEETPGSCENSEGYREVLISKQNLLLKPAVFGSCDERPNYVKVQVDMNNISDIYTNGKVWVDVLEQSTSYSMLDNDGDAIYDVIIPAEKGTTISYKFSYQNGTNENTDKLHETVPGSCNNGSGYRTYITQSEFVELLPVVFGTCEEALPEGDDITDLEGTEIRGSNDYFEWEGASSGSGSPDGQEVDKLIDNNINSRYLVRSVDSWIDIISTKLTKVHAYTITSGSDVPTRDPRSWEFQGLNMETEVWETIHTVVGNPMWQNRIQRKSWYFENDNWYGGYRLHIQEINGNSQLLMQMAELEIFGVVGEDSPGIGGSGDFLDDCDLKIDWNPSSLILNNSDKKQGLNCLEYTGDSTPEFYKVFSTPYDAQGTELGTTLQFWYYVSDPSMFESTNQVEISSSGKSDTDEYSWNLSGLDAGWNFIQLSTSNAKKIGNPDLSAINWFRIYRFKSGSVTTRVDAIQLIGENRLSIENVVVEKLFTLFPNPAATEFYFNFTLSNSSTVSITLVNMNGQIVSQRINKQELKPGSHRFEVPVDNLNSGIYFARIKIGDAVFTKKVIIK